MSAEPVPEEFDFTGLSAPGTKAGVNQRAMYRLWREHQAQGSLPTSLRFLHYERVQRGEVDENVREADEAEALTRLREVGLVPWGDIVDRSRSVTRWPSAPTLREGLLDQLEVIRLSPWDGPAPLIITESRSLAGVLHGLAYEYVVPIVATGGQSSGSLIANEVAPLFADDPDREVLYLGDWNRAGEHIESSTRARLERHVGHEVNWPDRIALTEEQARGLPVKVKEDRRYAVGNPRRFYDSVETEAMSQQVIVALVQAALEERLPESLADVLVREQDQRDRLRALLVSESR